MTVVVLLTALYFMCATETTLIITRSFWLSGNKVLILLTYTAHNLHIDTQGSCLGAVPNNEIRVGLLHDKFLRANVLLLSCVNNVSLLQDLHGEGFVLVAFKLNLQWEKVKGHVLTSKDDCCINCVKIPIPTQHGQSHQHPECRWC